MSKPEEHNYIPAYLPPEASENSSWALIFINKKLLMKKHEAKYVIPEVNELKNILAENESMIYIGRYEEHDCYCKRINEDHKLPENMEPVELREITNLSGDTGLFLLAGTANHILHWDSVHQYCGSCGHKTINKKEERAKECPNCGNITYPRISPATITAIFRGDQILLAHNNNFRKNLYSLIAGYVEPGETLEQCVAREIFEEVGLKVKNIRYFCSQPWPFPDALMMAFTAEYESGEIKVDKYEITDAGWYNANNLPEIPNTDSVAGKLIRWYRDQRKRD